jgi:hypothetical protein
VQVRPAWWPRLWAVVLALLVLWPVLGSGYVLSYDMVWVPDLALRPDALGLGTGLPRAVPSDAVVAVLDQLVPGMLLQKVVLVGALVGAGCGAVRLVPGLSLTGRLVAVTTVVWNPFVVERLVLGHWPVLLGYAVLPWLVAEARRVRAGGRVTGAVCWLVLLGSLSASAGLVTAVVLLVLAGTRGLRTTAALLAVVAGANAPWLVTGALHAAGATSDPAGAGLFALHGEGRVPGPLAALTLGGVWNADVVPPSRQGAVAWLTLLLVLGLAAAGWSRWRRGAPRRERWGLPLCWALGWGVAALTWAAPGAVGALAAHVPGGGLLRDGARTLGLCAPLLVTLVAHGADRVVSALRDRLPAPAVSAAAGALVLAPLALMPDAAGGAGGRLEPVSYPASYTQVRGAVGAAIGDGGGDALVLPFTSYRAPRWNGGRPVLDPMGRFLDVDHLASDQLLVSGTTVEGEDPRGDVVRRALAADGPQARSAALAAAGVAVVVVEEDTGQQLPQVAGDVVLDVAGARVVRLAGVVPRRVPGWWWVAAGGAWAAFASVAAAGLAGTVAALRSGTGPGARRRRRRGRGRAATLPAGARER